MAYVYKVRRRTPAPVAVEPVEAPTESPAAAAAAVTVAAPKKRKATGPKKPRRKKSDG